MPADCGGGLRVTVLDLLADLFTQVVVHPVEGAVGDPGLEVVVDEFRVGTDIDDRPDA